MKMAVNVIDVQEHQSVESVHPKLRPIKSHPYLNTYSTPPLPKPSHFHQFSDQTGQTTHKHQSSTCSLPQQFSVTSNNDPFNREQFNLKSTTNFGQLNTIHNPQAIYSQIDKTIQATGQSLYQSIDKPGVYLNGNANIEQYETTFNYSDLDKVPRTNIQNQQIYINHPIINRSPKTENSLKNGLTDDHSNSSLSVHLDKQSNGLNGGELTDQMNYQRVNSYFNAFDNHRAVDHQSAQTTYHGLPMKFVKALQKLFNVFDANKCGLIRIVDIESRIRDEEFDEELDRPQDLIESLRKVTSPNGLINFSNFCAAINICLLKNQLAKNKQHDYKAPIKPKNDRNNSYLRAQNIEKSLERNGFSMNGHHTACSISNGQISKRISNGNYHQSTKYGGQPCSSLNSNSPFENSSFTSTSSSNSSSRLHKDFMKSKSNQTATLNNKLKYRPSSVPVEFDLNNDEETDYYKNSIQHYSMNKQLDSKAKSMGNLKEQIYANKLRLCSSESRIQQNMVISPQAIMERLFEWRNNLLERKLRLMNVGNQTNGNSNISQIPFNRPPALSSNTANPPLNHLYSIVNKKTNPRKRDEIRRHTVTSLHSLNTAKKLLNMQKEKDHLQQGLLIIDRAKQFYLRQLDIVQNQIDYLNQHTQSGNNFFINQLNSDYNIKQHLDKINTLEQINRNLVLLMDNQFSQANPLNNLQPEIEKQNLTIFKLKEQVQMLSDELMRKSNIITNLEKSNPFLRINQ